MAQYKPIQPTVQSVDIPFADGLSPQVIVYDEMVDYLTDNDFRYLRACYKNSKGANEMNQKYIDDNGVTIYGYKPEAVVKAEKKREGKAEKLLKHLSPEEINYVREHPHILDALGKQASNPLYKRASKEMARTKAEQLVKASEKYPEPLNPESWTGEQLADHAFQEVFDLTSYITGMKIKFEQLTNDRDFHKEMNEHIQDLYNYKEKAHQSTIKQAQNWKKTFEIMKDMLELAKSDLERKKDEWMTASYDADMFKQQRDELQEQLKKTKKDFRVLEMNHEDNMKDLNRIAEQKVELMNSNHRLKKQLSEINAEKNQLSKDNSLLEAKVKDLQVEAKLWKDKFHLIKPTLEEEKHNCQEHATPIYNMNVLEYLECGKCGIKLWSQVK